jgi:hypothetical protein
VTVTNFRLTDAYERADPTNKFDFPGRGSWQGGWAGTVENLFDIVESAIEQHQLLNKVAFDEEYGFPSEICIGISLDEPHSIGYTATNFSVITPPADR